MACQPKAKYTSYKKIYAFFSFSLNYSFDMQLKYSFESVWKYCWFLRMREKKNCNNQAMGKSRTTHMITNFISVMF